MHRRLGVIVGQGAAAVLLLLTGCGGPDTAASSGTASATGSSPDSSAAPSLEGSFDVGGHSLAMSCWGTGSPTVVYLHGFIDDPAGGGATNAGKIPSLLAPKVRVCTYDRANVGSSGKSAGRQTGADSIRDLHALLSAADVPPPYVLLGASFGGLLASLYAASHPADVRGMVLLDASLPDDLDVERRIVGATVLPPPGWQEAVEQIDQAATYREAQALVRNLPAIPVTYLATKTIDLPPSYPAAELTAAIRQTQQTFLDRFSPGRLELVDAPHYMEPEIPDRIATEVHAVIATG
jgi:pimeloyl-ACP methyl ester carboxylesterase